MTKLAIKVENVHKYYKALKAVDDLSFEVPVGSCFGFLGPNGAGKTTMMKILYGTAARDSAENDAISVFGYDPQKNELEIKYVSENYYFNPRPSGTAYGLATIARCIPGCGFR